MSLFRSLLVLSVLVLLPGCVSKPVEIEMDAPPLMIAQNSDGDVTIAWESEPGYLYTIYYQNAVDGNWNALRLATRVRGTGKTLTTRDRVNPSKPLRRYRILPEKQD